MIQPLKVSAWVLLEGLGTGFYKDPADCEAEILRNGEVACMDKGYWEPQKGNVEIFIEKNHPMSPSKGKALIFLDHGAGFTTVDLDRFLWLGPSLKDESVISGKGTHGGAAQKRIGRLSALALNSFCANLDLDLATRAQHGFYIFTRTSPSGDVRMISFIPASIEEKGIDLDVHIKPQSTELGSLKGIKGSFSAVVIPDPVVDSEVEIREHLKWKLPRKKELLPRVIVGGKQMVVPDLIRRTDKKFTHTTKSGIEAYIQRAEDSSDENERGIWLCDKDTGFRVACCTSFSERNFVAPMFLPHVTGDIFIPGLLSKQNSSRSGLHAGFANKRNPVWRKICMEFLQELCPRTQDVIGNDDLFRDKEGNTKVLEELVDQMTATWGKGDFPAPPPRPEPSPDRKPGVNGGNGGGSGGGGGGKTFSVKIGKRSYKIRHLAQDVCILADIYKEQPETIYVNMKAYGSMPKNPSRRAEHLLCKILEAVGRQMFKDNPRQVSIFVSERRKEMGDLA